MMRTMIFKLKFIISSLIVFQLVGLPSAMGQASIPSLPALITWSSYDVGSAGYSQAAAISDALSKRFNTKVRILPSGTSVGRLLPLKTGACMYGFLADEVSFAVEALYEFSSQSWGPQDLRVVLAHPAGVGLVATRESGIRTVSDLRGKRLASVIGAPTIYVKLEAILAFGGLTWSDVQKVEFASHTAALRGLIEGKADAYAITTTAPILYELEASPRGIYWPEFPAADVEGWKRLQKICPWIYPGREGRGAGLDKGKPRELLRYPYPQLTCYANRSADEVYALIKAIDLTFDLYKDADPAMPEWAIDQSGRIPAGAPFHEGAIRYLKEKGMWREREDDWNKKYLERMKRIKQAWEQVMEEASSKRIPEKNFPEFWLQRKKEILGD